MGYRIYDSGFTGPSEKEGADEVTFFNWVRTNYPDTYGKLAFHVKNEGKRTRAQVQMEKAHGMTKGVSDIIIPGNPTFVCELKRKNKKDSKIYKEQKEYLTTAQEMGCFACLCYGYEQAILAFEEWRDPDK